MRSSSSIVLTACVLFVACTSTPSDQASSRASHGTTASSVLIARLSTDALAYDADASPAVTFVTFGGAANDAVVIAPAGSSLSTFEQKWLSKGVTSGVRAFKPLAPGTWVARAIDGPTGQMVGESASFTVAAADPLPPVLVTPDRPLYSTTDPVLVSWSGFPGYRLDRITVAPEGAADAVFERIKVLSSQRAGVTMFPSLPAGRYVPRAFVNGASTRSFEGAPFEVVGTTGPAMVALSVADDATPTVTWAGLDGHARERIVVAFEGAPAKERERKSFTTGWQSGAKKFPALGPGRYVARLFDETDTTLVAESPAVDVAAPTPLPVVSLAATGSLTTSQPTTVTWSGLSGYSDNVVTVAVPGSPLSSYVKKLTAGTPSGKAQVTLGAGTYVLRYFERGSFDDVEAEQGAFTVAERGAFLWAKRYGLTSTEGAITPQNIAVDSDGNVYMSARFRGTIDVGTGPLTSIGTPSLGYDINDTVVLKLDVTGNLQWAKHIATPSYARAQVATDPAGAVVVGGVFLGTLDLGGGPLTSASPVGSFLAKFDGSGAHLWSKIVASGDSDAARLACDGLGNIYTASNTSSGAVRLAKYTPDGSLVWSKKDGSKTNIWGFSVNAAGRLAIGMETYEEASIPRFGTSPYLKYFYASEWDVLVSLDADGAPLWNWPFYDDLYGVGGTLIPALDAAGNTRILVLGGAEEIEFSPTVRAAAFSPLASFDAAGVPQWAGEVGYLKNDVPLGEANGEKLHVAPDGDMLIAGRAYGTVDLGEGPVFANELGKGSAPFLVRISPSGALLWSRITTTTLRPGSTAGGSSIDGVAGSAKIVAFAGTVNNQTVDFHGVSVPSVGPLGKSDLIIAAYAP